MDQTGFETWLDQFKQAWQTKDTDAFRSLFAEEFVYQETPFHEPVVDRAALLDANATDLHSQENIQFDCQVVTVTDQFGIAEWDASFVRRLTFRDQLFPSHLDIEMAGIFKISLTDDGLCTELREWRNIRPLEEFYSQVIRAHKVRPEE